MIQKLLKQGRIPSPLIIEGDDRASIITGIARFALCEKTGSAEEVGPCNECRGCKQAIKGFHPDWIQVEGAVKIEGLRDALFQLRQKPYSARWRVFSCPDAQETNLFVQNALLKTLEEPLPHWVLLLGVNSRFGLIETIRSRCLIYKQPPSNQAPELGEVELQFFEAVARIDEMTLQKLSELLLKERQKAKALFQNLLRMASAQSYPGHWRELAPTLEKGLTELARNLNPRIIWDNAWASSFNHPL